MHFSYPSSLTVKFLSQVLDKEFNSFTPIQEPTDKSPLSKLFSLCISADFKNWFDEISTVWFWPPDLAAETIELFNFTLTSISAATLTILTNPEVVLSVLFEALKKVAKIFEVETL